MDKEDFEKLVKEAVEELPEKIRRKMDNVVVCVEENPNEEHLEKTGVKAGFQLLGLYQGVPKSKWGRSFGMRLPDKITIFKKQIEQVADSEEKIKEIVKNIVWHEIAHHFGFNEKEVRNLQIRRKRFKITKRIK